MLLSSQHEEHPTFLLHYQPSIEGSSYYSSIKVHKIELSVSDRLLLSSLSAWQEIASLYTCFIKKTFLNNLTTPCFLVKKIKNSSDLIFFLNLYFPFSVIEHLDS